MLKLRIVTAGAILAFAASAAAAQSNDTDATGTPVSLFKLLFHSTEAKPEPQAKPEPKPAATKPTRTVRHVHRRATRVAAATEDPVPIVEPVPERTLKPEPTAWTAQAAIDAAPPSIWPAGNAPIFAGVLDSEPREATVAAPASGNDQTLPKVGDAQSTAAVALAAQDDDGRSAWFEAILASLGGALAAGAFAWFLMDGNAPQPDVPLRPDP
jgi:hypothetical protein